jgi:predicted nucleic acid-binding protein
VSRKILRILLDTSFTLPFLGFKTSEVVMKALPRLRGHELYYSDLSILEALWKIVKVVKREDLAVVLDIAMASHSYCRALLNASALHC